MATHDTALPVEGVPRIELEAQLRALLSDDVRSHWARAFRGPRDVQDIGRLAYDIFRDDNGIFSLRAEHMRLIEVEVTNMCLSLFHPPAEAGATFTSGGASTILWRHD